MSEASFRIAHLEVESPWGNAGGVIKTVEEAEKMAQTGVGWLEAGSFTLERRWGNQRDKDTGELIIDPETNEPVIDYYFDPETGEAYNSLGMPNHGRSVFKEDIPEMVRIAESAKKKLIVNVAPVSNDPVAETVELVSLAFESGAHGVIVNGGCPNVIVEREQRHEILSLNAISSYVVLSGLKSVVEKYRQLVFYRLSPQPTREQAQAVFHSVVKAGTTSAVWTPNTWGGKKPLRNGKPALTIEGNIGGLSGPATADASAEQTRWAVEALKGTGIDVVRSGGIMNAMELKRSIDLGAVAGAGTTFYYQPVEGWAKDTYRLLNDFSKINT